MILIEKSAKNDRILVFWTGLEGKMRLFREISAILLGAVLCFAASSAAFATAASIVGNWQTIDHKTDRPSSIIQIWEYKGKFFGKVAKIYSENGHKITDRCARCKGALRNKRILGLVIIADMVFNKGMYTGGRILDPINGKIYHCRAKVTSDGRRLMLRGYIGIPLLGRTDTWIRVPNHS